MEYISMAVLLIKARYKNHLGNIREQANKGGDTINELDARKPIYGTYLCSLIYQVKYDVLVRQIVGTYLSVSWRIKHVSPSLTEIKSQPK